MISFVIPYYDKLKSIKKCLDSLFDQSVKDIEVIIVVDGPDVDASKLFAKYARKHAARFKVKELSERGGAPHARNVGREMATGDYISFWDADSYIKPGATAVWLQAFELHPDVDFVYAGYEFPEGMGGINGEPFDVRQLETSNYISGHFPIKREKCPKWDESLKSLQDWDFWLQAVRGSCKGLYMQGSSFRTEPPSRDSISGIGCTDENWLPRRKAVKAKHGIPDREVCVCALEAQGLGRYLAEILDADFSNFLTTKPHEYKAIVQIGWNTARSDECAMLFLDPKKEAKKVIFWRGQDVQTLLRSASFVVCEALAFQLNRVATFQFCEDKVTRDYLQKLGFRVALFPLPYRLEPGLAPLPEKTVVLVDVANEFKPFFDGVARAMPDVEFKTFAGAVETDKFTALLQFLDDKSMSDTVKKVLLSGRHVLSNVQAPFCGYVSDYQSLEEMRRELVSKIRAIQKQGLNMEAREHYAQQCNPERFKKMLLDILKPTSEAVPA